jgi:hypothetical protein
VDTAAVGGGQAIGHVGGVAGVDRYEADHAHRAMRMWFGQHHPHGRRPIACSGSIPRVRTVIEFLVDEFRGRQPAFAPGHLVIFTGTSGVPEHERDR